VISERSAANGSFWPASSIFSAPYNQSEHCAAGFGLWLLTQRTKREIETFHVLFGLQQVFFEGFL